MRHPTDGTLRRLVDEPAGVADADREHVAGCPVCLSGLAAAQEDAAVAGAALDVELAVDVDAGWHRLSRAVAVDGAGGRPRPPRARRWRAALRSPVVAAVGVVALAGRGRCRGRRRLAADLPDRADRPGHGHPRPTWSSCPTSPPTASVEVTEEADVREVADAAAAEEATGLSVPRVSELPRGVTGEPAYQVGGQVSAVFTFSAEKAAQAAAAAGETLPPPPAGPRRQPVPAGRRPGARRGLVGSPRRAGPGRGPRRSHPPRTPRASRSRRPATTCCPCPVCPRTSRRSCAASPATGRRCPCPCRPRQVTSSAADVGGVPATVLTSRDGVMAGVVWVDDGVVTAVAGSLSADEVLSVARGLR